ncbi:MAG: hypothetical protein ACR2MU_06420 [Gaiellaceae bacterium]
MIFRRRFADTIARQLDLFAVEEAGLIADCEAAERAYDRADRDDAIERYAAYDDLLDSAAQALAEIRDGFALSLGEETAEQYAKAFDRAAAKRFGKLALGLPEI